MLTVTGSAPSVVYGVFWDTDLTKTSIPSPFETTTTITLSAVSGSTTTTSTFDLTVKNPCVDADYNPIVAPSPYDVYYEVSSVAKTIDYSLGFPLVTALHSLCGTISYTTSLSTGLAYVDNAPATTFTIYTTD